MATEEHSEEDTVYGFWSEAVGARQHSVPLNPWEKGCCVVTGFRVRSVAPGSILQRRDQQLYVLVLRSRRLWNNVFYIGRY